MARAWVYKKRFERLVLMDKNGNGRLTGAMEMARQAGKDDIERRRKLSLAAILWRPVLAGCGRKKMMTMTTLVEKVTQNLRKRLARRCLKKSTGELNFSCESTNLSF